MLLDRTPAEAEIVYLAHGARPARAEGLKAILGGRKTSFLSGPNLLAQNVARNLGARHAQTNADYYVFLDNDIVVEPGWLDALVRGARESGAGVVGPLMLEGDPSKKIVHMIGGVYREIDTPSGKIAFERHYAGHRPMADLDAPPVRRAVDFVEGHCMLVSRRAFEACGGFDEQILTMFEYIDMSLRARAAGYPVIVEPDAVATYEYDAPLTVEDVPIYLTRWDVDDTRATFDHFAHKRVLRRDCELIVYGEEFVRQHRGRFRLFDAGAEWARAPGGARFPAPQTLAGLEDVLSAGGFSISGCRAALWFSKALRHAISGLAPPHTASAETGFRAAHVLIGDGGHLELIAAALLYPLLRSGGIAKGPAETLVKDAGRFEEFVGLGPLLNSIYALDMRPAETIGSDFGAAPAEALRPAAVLMALAGAQDASGISGVFAGPIAALEGAGFRGVASAFRGGAPH